MEIAVVRYCQIDCVDYRTQPQLSLTIPLIFHNTLIKRNAKVFSLNAIVDVHRLRRLRRRCYEIFIS